jgi:hypothetical protein
MIQDLDTIQYLNNYFNINIKNSQFTQFELAEVCFTEVHTFAKSLHFCLSSKDLSILHESAHTVPRVHLP